MLCCLKERERESFQSVFCEQYPKASWFSIMSRCRVMGEVVVVELGRRRFRVDEIFVVGTRILFANLSKFRHVSHLGEFATADGCFLTNQILLTFIFVDLMSMTLSATFTSESLCL